MQSAASTARLWEGSARGAVAPIAFEVPLCGRRAIALTRMNRTLIRADMAQTFGIINIRGYGGQLGRRLIPTVIWNDRWYETA